MALRLLAAPSNSILVSRKPLFPCYPSQPSSSRLAPSSSLRPHTLYRSPHFRSPIKPRCSQQSALQEQTEKAPDDGKVSAVLFDMDGVLCNSEEPSRMAAVDVFTEMGVAVTAEDFVPFMGTGEANFLGGVAKAKGVLGFDPEIAKKRFFEIYLDKYAKPNSGIGFPGALELIQECKKQGLKVAVASSADRIKVDANLAAAGLSISLFDAIVSADAFENLKPAPDIFLAAANILNVTPTECIVIEDALAGVQAANAAQMRCIAVTTTLSEQKLQQAGPVLIKKDIGSVSLQDILGLKSHKDSAGAIEFSGGLQGSRSDIVRFGSLGITLSCLYYVVSNWKTTQYASPKGLMNKLFGGNNNVFIANNGKSQSTRVQQFLDYLSDFEGRKEFQYVPEFPSKLEWLNSPPLLFSKDLRGKIVLLDFWTYCCINCMHVLPDLAYLEKKYADNPFVVIGVHSAKFDNEKDSEAIRNAVLRYNITHPVVNDANMSLWRDLGIHSWPTFVIVGPDGQLLGQISGEGHKKDLDNFVEASLLFYGKRNLLSNKSLPLALEKDADFRSRASPLNFPGKLAVDSQNGRVFISDSNHNRIVVTDLDGNFIVQIGSSGEAGLQDGSFDEATFNRPQGVAYNPRKNLLYVADTENHALREIDFINEMVRTLAGNGNKGSDRIGGGKGTTQVLNSPWDVCFDSKNEVVYIAMAGLHQIWQHRTSDGVTRFFSGDGYERNVNGSSSTNTSFAQPSGISVSPNQEVLYVADSESSSVRAVDLKTGGSKLLAGGDPLFSDNLFKFGDRDGIGSDVLLQHPLGVLSGSDGLVYIADSYNHKIKELDPVTNRVVTVAGTGTAGFKDAPALSSQLSEPSGLVEIGSGEFLVADTNNNLIRRLQLKSNDSQLRTFELKDVPLPAPQTKSMKRLRRRVLSDAEVVRIRGSASTEGNLYLQILVPKGYHLSKEASSKYDVETDPTNDIRIEPLKGTLSSEGNAVFHFRRVSSSVAAGRIHCKVYYCKEDEVCLYQALVFDVSFPQESADSNTDVSISYTVKPKVLQAQFAFAS